MRSYLGYCFLTAFALLLTACGGGGGETPNPVAAPATPVTTDFRVSVDLPDQMTLAQQRSLSLLPQAYANAVKDLTEQNFAAVWLDDKGKVLESIELTDWQTNGEGIYTFTGDTKPRVNAVLLIDPAGIPEFTLGEALPEGLYMTPLASERLTVTLETSMTYYALTKRIVKDGNWGVFTEVFTDAPQGKVLFALQDINNMALDIRDTLFPQIGLEGMTLKDLMQLSIVKSMTDGRIERFYTEQDAALADIKAILNDGYWQVAAGSSNNGTVLMSDHTSYNGSQTEVAEFRWKKSGNEDINLSEFFTYLSGSTAFGTEDVTHQVLTSQGWTGLFSYLKVILATQRTAMLTDAGLTKDDKSGISLEANVYSLSGKRIHDFLSSRENHFMTRYIKDTATFDENASGFYFTWRPEKETYLLCDTTNDKDTCRVYSTQLPDTAFTSLDDLITAQANAGPEFESVNGFKLSDNVVVEIIDDGLFTVRYWSNIAVDEWVVQEQGVWSPVTIAGKQMIRFDVPDVIKQLSDNYRFNSLALFLVVDRGFVNIGETLLDGEQFHYSGFDNDAKDQIFAAATRDNLPAFDNCIFGNTALANEDLFLNAVTECGGDEHFTTQGVSDLVDKTLVQIAEDGEITAQILRSDNTWEFYRHTEPVSGSNRSWTLLDNSYLKVLENADTPDSFEYWAKTNYDYALRVMAIKQYIHPDNGQPEETVITNFMAREYQADQLAACSTNDSGWDQTTTTPMVKKTQEEYQTQAASCKQAWYGRVPRFTEALLVGQTGNLSDDKALTFASDTSRYLKLTDNFSGDYFLGSYVDSDGCGFNFDIRWKLEDDGTLYYEAIDGSMKERIQLSDTDGLKLAIKAFNHQTRWETDDTLLYGDNEGEIWSDIVTLIDASEVPDVVPIEAPETPPPAEGEPPAEPTGPPAGTILNDGQTCAFTEQPAA